MHVLDVTNSPETIAARTAAIRQTILRESAHITRPDFTRIGTDDLARLFGLYDEQFFGGWLGRTVLDTSGVPLGFRLSSTMTRAGGKTMRRRRVGPGGVTMDQHFEIAVGSTLLFMTFNDIQRPVVVCGLTCPDRLHALQRIMEHEIIHLAELLAWGRSSCTAQRFKTLAWNIFGHTLSTHDLVTPRERAAVNHDIRIGSRVEFDYEGQKLVGRVNRIHQRATVLVEAADGMRYSDGGTYRKYYVPLSMLRPVQ